MPRKVRLEVFFAVSLTLGAQTWPCVSRKAPDRSFADVAEASGGQVILAAPDEIEKTVFLHIQRPSHTDTIFRSTATLFNETREFRFPVDSTIENLLVSVMLACKGEIAVLTGKGTEAAGEGFEIKGGRVLRVLRPEPGEWRLRLRGDGFYSIVVEGKSAIHFDGGAPSGNAGQAAYRLTGDEGETLLRLDGPPGADFQAPYPRYRAAVEGTDAQGFPFQRLTRQMMTRPPAQPRP